MKNAYCRLSLEEREEISRGLACGHTFACIAMNLGRPVSTISRDVERHDVGLYGYRAANATNRARRSAAGRRRGKMKLASHPNLESYVIEKLIDCWSPEQIVRKMFKEYPDDTTMRISHEAIYHYIYVLPRGELRALLIRNLRRGHKYRYKKGGSNGDQNEKRGKIAGMLSIEERPKEVTDRIVPGHWEGDLIMGKRSRTALGTLVERTTRYTILVPLKAWNSQTVRRAYAREMRKLPKELTRTLTYDRGSEMRNHQQFTVDTGIQVYFANPGRPWERGTNENTNGLVRQFFPRGTDFSMITNKEIKRVQRLLNGRPRMTLGWEKPEEVFNKLIALNS